MIFSFSSSALGVVANLAAGGRMLLLDLLLFGLVACVAIFDVLRKSLVFKSYLISRVRDDLARSL